MQSAKRNKFITLCWKNERCFRRRAFTEYEKKNVEAKIEFTDERVVNKFRRMCMGRRRRPFAIPQSNK